MNAPGYITAQQEEVINYIMSCMLAYIDVEGPPGDSADSNQDMNEGGYEDGADGGHPATGAPGVAFGIWYTQKHRPSGEASSGESKRPDMVTPREREVLRTPGAARASGAPRLSKRLRKLRMKR